MVKEAGLNPGEMVAIFPQASAEQDSSFYYAKQQFEKRNLKAIDFAFKKGEKLPQSKLDSLKKVKLIYVGGGDQGADLGPIGHADQPSRLALALEGDQRRLALGPEAANDVLLFVEIDPDDDQVSVGGLDGQFIDHRLLGAAEVPPRPVVSGGVAVAIPAGGVAGV